MYKTREMMNNNNYSFNLNVLHNLFIEKDFTFENVFSYFSNHKDCLNFNTMDDWIETGIKNNIFCKCTRKNLYIPNNFSININIPFIVNKADGAVKSIQFVKGFTNKYELKITNYLKNQDGIPLFAISDIKQDSGILGLTFRKERDHLVLNDNRIDNGTTLMILGLSIAQSFRMQKLVLSDNATVECGGRYAESPLQLTLYKKIIGNLGFYEKFGFVIDSGVEISINMLSNARMIDIMYMIGKSFSDENITLKEFVLKLHNKDMTENLEVYCSELSNLLKAIALDKHDCMKKLSEYYRQLCEAVSYIESHIHHQEKIITFRDFENVQKLFQ